MPAIDLYAAAELGIEKRAEASRRNLAAAMGDVLGFQSLCGRLHERGLIFSPSVYASEVGIQYWIHTRKPGENAGKIMLALAAMGCDGTEVPSNIPDRTRLTITGPRVPEFHLVIMAAQPEPCAPRAAACHGAALAG